MYASFFQREARAGCFGRQYRLRTQAQGWCTGMTPRDEMGRVVLRMGNTCTPKADSCQCMAKTTTIL